MTGTRTLLATRYELLERIGAGGMATVWRGRDLRLGRQVALKLLRPQFAEDPEFVTRFQVEARNAASLAHPNVATVFDTGVDAGRHFIAMELVDGPSVADILRARGPLPPGQAVDIAAAAARALAAAHRRGLIHRDVKPANILVGRDGRVRLADFGIARALTTSRVTAPGTVLGSIPYLSPEQARGEEATASGDVFSLGVVLFEMLTGRLPWAADGPAALATVRTTEPPTPPSAVRTDLPPGLDGIVGRALELDPATRYPSARAFAETLEAWARKHASMLPDEPDLADTAALVAAASPHVVWDDDDILVTGIPAGQAVAGAALARANPSAPRAPRPTAAPPAAPNGAAVAGPATSPGSPAGAARSSTTALRSVAPRAVGREGREARRRRRDGLIAALAGLAGLAVIAVLALGTLFGASRGGGEAVATASPGDLAVVPPIGASASPSPSPSEPSASPPSPSPSARPTPSATPEPTPPPTPKPTPRPTPRPTPAPTPGPTSRPALATSQPAKSVAAFYGAVAAHDWDTAIDLWSPSMQERYPPQEWLVDRFRRTTRIDITRLKTLENDPDGGRARVAVTIVEYRTVEPSPRTFSGAWDLVLIDGRWLLDDPDF